MPSPQEHPPPNPSVLVIDDDDSVRTAQCVLLEGEGFDVRSARNGAEALLLLATGPFPDLILLDLNMPVMDGWQFRVAQKLDPRLAYIPTIVTSAADSAQALAIDAAAFVPKSTRFDELLRVVRTVLAVITKERARALGMAQTDRLASLGVIAAGVAHEINNPLAFVMSNLSFVIDQLRLHAARNKVDASAQEELVQALEDAQDGAARIRSIVDDLRTFSCADIDASSRLDLCQVMDAALRLARPQLKADMKLVKHYDTVPQVFGNPVRLAQVCLNLVVNACQAVAATGAEHRITVATLTDAQGRAVLEVSDTGTGIPPQIIARIFDPFFTTKPAGVGTGLGLSICHGLVTGMGGEISVTSELGKGTCFRVSLPVAASVTARQASVE